MDMIIILKFLFEYFWIFVVVAFSLKSVDLLIFCANWFMNNFLFPKIASSIFRYEKRNEFGLYQLFWIQYIWQMDKNISAKCIFTFNYSQIIFFSFLSTESMHIGAHCALHRKRCKKNIIRITAIFNLDKFR